jgi:chaperone modulatory protein CbpM
MTQPKDEQWHRLDGTETIGLEELAQACAVSAGELQELVEYGALAPAPTLEEQGLFSAECVIPLRTACRLRRDYDLDLFTVGLLLQYLQRIEQLEREIHSLRAHLPAHVTHAKRDAPASWREPHGSGGG